MIDNGEQKGNPEKRTFVNKRQKDLNLGPTSYLKLGPGGLPHWPQ